MTPQILIPGLWVYIDKTAFPYYIGNINNQTAQVLRKTAEGKYTDSEFTLFPNLIGIPLDREILEKNFGFSPSLSNDDYVYKELYAELKVTRGDNVDVVKPATNLFIEIDESFGKRFTTFLECGLNKIFVSELSFVHELQLFIFTHTGKFPYLTITKTKSNAKESE